MAGWTIENRELRIRLAVDEACGPVLESMRLACRPQQEWVARPCAAFGPRMALELGDEEVQPRFRGGRQTAAGELELRFDAPGDVSVSHWIRLAEVLPVVRSWTEVDNSRLPGLRIRRLDSLGATLGCGRAEPTVSYVTGWLDGPRCDAPGRHAVPYRYGGWIPRFLYGEGVGRIADPPAGWVSGVHRLVQERLTRLPLRSGGRSTYDDHPWAAVRMDGGGFFAGLAWSGSWRLEVEHHRSSAAVNVAAGTSGYVHELRPGERHRSPEAFLGLFVGDWDDAFNATRRWVRMEVLPPAPRRFPGSLFFLPCTWSHPGGHAATLREIDAAADLGFDYVSLDTFWWASSAGANEDFSIGLGDFEDHRGRFPQGLRAVSDHAHRRGMGFGLWFEFERVDIRTANRGPVPWRPEWIVHRGGYPHRSWCQHVYNLCLGVPEAAQWALDNLSRAVERYGVDWFVMDSNEWAVCDDPSHGHGRLDGEWAQVHGLYRVLDGLRRRFPGLIMENCAGGGQRDDFGMMRYCNHFAVHDTNIPSAFLRQMSHGLGCLYPNACQRLSVPPLPSAPGYLPTTYPYPRECDEPSAALTDHGSDLASDAAELEWRVLNALTGNVIVACKPRYSLRPGFAEVLRRATALVGRIRSSLWGDRYVLLGPSPIVERENREHARWEAYEFLSPDGAVVTLFCFRCGSPDQQMVALLRGLDAEATYRLESHRLGPRGEYRGAALMRTGVEVRLEAALSADVLILERVQGGTHGTMPAR